MRCTSPSFRLHRRQLCAFTLIELLVVIVILGILMAVAVPTFLRQQTKAQDSRTQQYLTTAFKAIRASTPETNNLYPQSASMVSWITQSEPELTAASGSCTTQIQTAPVDKILVDPASTPTALTICARSQSGNVYKLAASNTGVQQLLDGTLVALTESGGAITDATRAANIQGDGRTADSSTGIWEGTTNLVSNGGFETDITGWSNLFNATISRSAAAAKFGSASLKIVSGSGGAAWPYSNSIAVTAGQQYALSAWGILGNRAGATLQVYVRWYDGSGTYLSDSSPSAPATVTSSGARASVVVTAPASAATARLTLQADLIPSAGDYIYADGVQLEQKPYPTPYVETNGATATRNAAQVQAPASLLGSTQGWVAIRVRLGVDSAAVPSNNYPRLFDWKAGAGQSIWAFYNADNGGRIYYDANGTGSWIADTFSAGSVQTVIVAWSGAGISLSLNGAAFTTPTSFAAFSGAGNSYFNIGGAGAVYQADSDVLWFACGSGTLSNADATTVSSWGSNDPKLAAFPAAAQATMIWDGSSSSGSLK